MGSKTPVSVLQEMMTRIGPLPKYELIYNGLVTHTAKFTYQVHVNNVTAVGSGRSKKEAKHEAARNALQKLAAFQIEQLHPPGAPPEPVQIVTPYADKIEENAIGALHELCCTHEIPLPGYKLIDERGAPHEKIFKFVCSVSKQKETGIGRTKKQAKQLAAFNMMNKLKESLGDVLEDVASSKKEEDLKKPNIKHVIAKYMSNLGAPRKRLRLNKNPSNYEFLSELPVENREIACNMLSDVAIKFESRESQPHDVNWMSRLDSVLEILEGRKKIYDRREGKNDKKIVFVQIILGVDAVFFGIDYCEDRALQLAAYKCLEFLKMQLLYEVKTAGEENAQLQDMD